MAISMENKMKNKNPGKTTQTETEAANHHANPSRVSPEIAAMGANDKPAQKGSEHHDAPKEDKKTNIQHLHQNGSTSSDRM